MSLSFSLPPLPGGKNLIPDGMPAHRVIDIMANYERWRNKPENMGVQGAQVQAFMALEKLHGYIADARRELEQALGTRLCEESCCCLRSTPFVTRLEAEYIVSMNGYRSQILEIAQQWLVASHEEAPTYPDQLPAIIGGERVPLRTQPQVAKEMRALAQLRSPFLLAERDSQRERIVSGPYVKTSYASGTSLIHAQNFDLLRESQPLTCAVSGVFKLAPEHCTRRPGIGEDAHTRAIAQPDTIMAGVRELDKVYEAYPDKKAYGLLPTMIILAAHPSYFKEMVKAGKVALAKIAVGMNRFPFPLWEEHPYGNAERKFTSSSVGISGGTRGR